MKSDKTFNKQIKLKSDIIKHLKKAPIVQVACERSGVSRATYYRWRKGDKKFRNEADDALLDGKKLINDMAESQLISAIKDKNLTAIIFWLKNHHASYKTQIELSGKIETTGEILTPDQENIIKEALKMASITANNINPNNHEPDTH